MTKQERQVAPHMGWSLEKTVYEPPGMPQESDTLKVLEISGRVLPDSQTIAQSLADGGLELVWQGGRLLTGVSAWLVCLSAVLVRLLADGFWRSSRQMADGIRRPRTDRQTDTSADGPRNITINVNPQITING